MHLVLLCGPRGTFVECRVEPHTRMWTQQECVDLGGLQEQATPHRRGDHFQGRPADLRVCRASHDTRTPTARPGVGATSPRNPSWSPGRAGPSPHLDRRGSFLSLAGGPPPGPRPGARPSVAYLVVVPSNRLRNLMACSFISWSFGETGQKKHWPPSHFLSHPANERGT